MRVVAVPDSRLERLRADWKLKKFSPASVELGDLPAYGGEKFFGTVRDYEALVFVVRAFKNDSVPHPKQRIDWKTDLEDIKTDLVVQDLAVVEKRVEKLEKSVKKPHTSTPPIKGRLEMAPAPPPEPARPGSPAAFGIQETIAAPLVRLAYSPPDQIPFLTAGDKEVRAWTITRGDNAVEAARKIH